jgi:hypothetical protein
MENNLILNSRQIKFVFEDEVNLSKHLNEK